MERRQSYSEAREHLFDELRLLELQLNLQIVRQRANPGHNSFSEFRGLFLSEEEIDELLGRRQTNSDSHDIGTGAEIQCLCTGVEELRDLIAERRRVTLSEGGSLPLLQLADLFQLSPLEMQALVVCLAPEIERKYEKLYAYLQNDVTRKRPTVDLILNLFTRTPEEKIRSRSRFHGAAPLFKNSLLHFAGERPFDESTLISRSLKLDDRIVDYLLNTECIDSTLAPFTRLIDPHATMADVLLPADLADGLTRLVRSHVGQVDAGGIGRFLFHGRAGVGKKIAAEALCQSAGLKLLVCDTAHLVSQGPDHSELLHRLFREARLHSAAVYLDRAESLLADNERAFAAKGALSGALADFSGILILGSEEISNLNYDLKIGPVISVPFSVPDSTTRKRLWLSVLTGEFHKTPTEKDLTAVADKFVFTFGQIRNAASEAYSLSSMRNHNNGEISPEDLYRACHSQSVTHLSSFARKITPLYVWDDLIVPADSRQQLQEICAHVNHRQRVLEEWRFSSKLSLGKGVSALFTGSPGTGKTMAADIIAGELGLDLFKIDLSCVVNKYIGETEKNLSKIFREAEWSNAILFFDEADAVFGKRSQVKDSHDRYANIEINYLLQRMEMHEGIVILASNFQKNIDEAFLRRLRFVIDFPFPDEEHRYRIWKNTFPHSMPVSEDIDFEFLAKRFKIAGGNIKNIALAAAFLAASESGVVTMNNVVCATRREFQKMGRLCVKADFEEYYELIEKEAATHQGEK